MSLLVEQVVTDAAMKFGDPVYQRIDQSDWLRHYNTATRDIASHWDVLEHRVFFTLEAGNDAYGYPADMVRLSEIAVSTELVGDPGLQAVDEDAFDDLGELFRDEFRASTRRRYPTGTPKRYYARQNWFHLIPKPDVQVVRGGRIHYFGLPDRLFTLSGALYQLPEFTQDAAIERMVIAALEQDERLTEASQKYQKWLAEGPFIEDRMQDRSKDRRENLRPPDDPYRGMA